MLLIESLVCVSVGSLNGVGSRVRCLEGRLGCLDYGFATELLHSDNDDDQKHKAAHDDSGDGSSTQATFFSILEAIACLAFCTGRAPVRISELHLG